MSTKYAEAHKTPNGPGDARPTASQIINDYNLQGKLAGKTVLITGCSAGLGIETARAIYQTGATIYATARNIAKAREALGDLAKDTARVHILELDLASLASVRACAEAFKAQSTQLNILIENAGVMACPEGRTQDGFETQFGTNHLGHFLLFQLLQEPLRASSSPDFHSRVVVLSSCAHQGGSVHLDNLTLQGEYEPWKAYGQSKTANLWTAREIEKRLGAGGVHAWAVHPGCIQTELQRHVPDELQQQWGQNEQLARLWKSVEQGAATTVLAAVSPELEGKGGLYLDDTQVAEGPPTGLTGVAPWAYDEEGPAKLWEKSLELIKLR